MQIYQTLKRGRITHQIGEHYRQMLLEPAPVEGVRATTVYRQFTLDPTVVVKQEIKDHQGQTIVAKGTSYNPLRHLQYDRALLFIDGTQNAHVAWAKTHSPHAHWILVKGRPLDLEDSENRPIFFDQKGILTRWLGIEYVPARVVQQGSVLKIEEVVVKEDGCEALP